jgi:DHA1 family chloramphenicol resistance protein-like MFS transporter
LVTRVVSGVAYAGFFAVASVTAISLVTPDRNARASGVVVSGLSVAMIIGGPTGTLFSHFTQWRGGFWAVTALTVAGMIGCALLLPSVASEADRAVRPSVSRELATMREPMLWGMYAITILTTAAYMITFNYLSAMLANITNIPEVWIPAILALFGLGAFVGLSIGGRVSDRRPHLALLTGTVAIVILSIVMSVAIQHVWTVIPVVFLIGIAAFVLNPAVYGRVFAIAAGAPTIAGATTVSAFQLGISITPLLAAASLAQHAALTSVCWLGATLAAVAVPLILADRAQQRRSTQRVLPDSASAAVLLADNQVSAVRTDPEGDERFKSSETS